MHTNGDKASSCYVSTSGYVEPVVGDPSLKLAYLPVTERQYCYTDRRRWCLGRWDVARSWQ